ncbi:hypothetical protein C2S52_001150 [Perilla frutescens var. hirtella]|nr:hypothetical protein C2S52_001150 [Perilla frutescens var. hirtella]
MAAKGSQPPWSGQPKNGDGSSSREKVDKRKLKCSDCGMSKHTKKTCFRLVGYPEWWEDNHKPPKENQGKAAVVAGNSEVVDTRHGGDGRGGEGQGGEGRSSGSGRTEEFGTTARVSGESNERGSHHTDLDYEGIGSDMSLSNPPNHYIFNSAGPISSLSGPSSFPTHNLVKNNCGPSINNVENYNCLAQAYVAKHGCRDESKTNAWIFDCGATDTMTFDASDICVPSPPPKACVQTASGYPDGGEIIGRGTERRGLYYVDEIAQKGTVMLVGVFSN